MKTTSTEKKKPLSFHKKMTIICAFLMVVMVISAMLNPAFQNSTKLDLNNFSIDKLSEEDIVSVSNQYRASAKNQKYYGEKSGVKGHYSKVDYNNCTFSSKKTTGIVTVSATLLTKGTLNIIINSTVSSGEGKLAVIRDDKVVQYLEFGQSYELNYEESEPHNYYVKVLCGGADIEITVTRQILGGN